MFTEPEGDHINAAGLPSRKLQPMGQEPSYLNLSGKEMIQFRRCCGEDWIKSLVTKLGVGNDTYKGMANCPLFPSHLEGSLTEHEESESCRGDIRQKNPIGVKLRHEKDQGQFLDSLH